MKPKSNTLFKVLSALVVALMVFTALPARPAAAAAGIDEDFRGASAPGWSFYGSANLTNSPAGNGWLELTPATNNQAGSAIYGTAFSNSAGIEVSFTYSTYGGSGADGFTFYLIDGSTGSPTLGAAGGALGYSWNDVSPIGNGVTNGYVGIGFDEYGNFANSTSNNYGTGGYAAGTTPGITVRGPGSLHGVGDFPYLTRAAATIAGTHDVVITITPSPTQTLTVVVDGVTKISSFDLSAYTMPATFKMGFSASTGGSDNYHLIRDLTVTGILPSYTSVVTSGSPSASGTSVTFTATVIDDQTVPTGTPTGQVGFYDNDFDTLMGYSTLNGSGIATYSTSGLSVGSHTIYAKYLGDSDYRTSWNSVAQTVVPCSAPTITSLSTVAGPLGGGTTTTITGTNFYSTGNVCAPTGATFGGAAGSSFSVTSPTTINVTTPTAAAAGVPAGGQVNVVVTGSPAGSSAPLVNGFVYAPPPTVIDVDRFGYYTPGTTEYTNNAGPLAGGQTVRVYGTNFMSSYGSGANWSTNSVLFGGAGTTCSVDSATQLTCTTPPDPYAPPPPNVVDVRVFTPGGEDGLFNDLYLYVPAPTITSLSLDIGPTTGGSPVVITGTNFKTTPLASYGIHGITWTTDTLTFGGTNAASYTVDSATQISSVTPAHVAGTVDVVATTPGGTGTKANGFSFVQAATLGLTPNNGPTAGGTVVTITGTNVGTATGVTFGGLPGTSLTVINATHITIVTPAHAAGLVDVNVLMPGGDQLLPNSYTFVPPAVAGVSPNSGPTAGGTTVTITSPGLGAGSGATFGGSTATCTFVTPNLSCITPPHSAGTFDVVVTGPGATTFTNAFTFVPPSLFADIYPNYGPIAGGTTVTIIDETGVDFTGTTQVAFGGTNATSFTVNSPTRLTAVTPAHAAGMVNIVVTAPAGKTYANSFTFYGSSIPLAPISDPVNGTFLLVTQNITSLKITFNMAMDTATWASSATNPANYMLIGEGPNELIDTQTCLDGVKGDDWWVTINSVTYNAATWTSTLNVNNGHPLPVGQYQLFACGTTSLKNLAGVELNGGLDDTRYNFVIQPVSAQLPATGFAPNRVTALPAQTTAYAALGDLWLEIPRLGVQMNIVGVPQSADGSWDVSWLGKDAGWLNNTAFPTWNGNSVITGHVWNADNTTGPFAYLNQLWYGDKVIIHAWGSQYVYEVRSVQQISPTNTTALFKHEELPWVTLLSCRGYDAASGTYKYRLLVRAVLVEVK